MTIECDYKQQHWIVPCRGTTPPDQFQAFLTEYTDTMVFIWILDISQLKKNNKKNVPSGSFRHEYYCQSSKNICDHILTLGG